MQNHTSCLLNWLLNGPYYVLLCFPLPSVCCISFCAHARTASLKSSSWQKELLFLTGKKKWLKCLIGSIAFASMILLHCNTVIYCCYAAKFTPYSSFGTSSARAVIWHTPAGRVLACWRDVRFKKANSLFTVHSIVDVAATVFSAAQVSSGYLDPIIFLGVRHFQHTMLSCWPIRMEWVLLQ